MFLVQASCFIRNYGPLTIPDTNMHATGAYALATGQSFNELVGWTDDYGNVQRTTKVRGDAAFLLLGGANEDVVSKLVAGGWFYEDESRIVQWAAAAGEHEQIVIPLEGIANEQNRSNQYFPLAWLPQAVGVNLGLGLGLDVYDSWQLARCVSAAFYCLLVLLALWLAPGFRLSIALFGALPINVYMASSLMCDGSLIVLVLLGVVATLNIRDSFAQPSRLASPCLLVCLAYIALVKAVYLPILLGFLLISKDRLSWRRKVILLVILMASMCGYLVWSNEFGNMALRCNLMVNKEFIQSHLMFVAVCLIANLPLILGQLRGMALYLYVSGAIVGVAFIAEAAKAIRAQGVRRWIKDNHIYWIGALVAALISTLGILYFLLLTWNDASTLSVGDVILGFQGRYLFELAPLLLYVGSARERLNGRIMRGYKALAG